MVDDYQIAAIGEDGFGYYDPADSVIEANGGFVLPGILNHHAHGLNTRPAHDSRSAWLIRRARAFQLLPNA